MNKLFSTLLAGILSLFGIVTVNAATDHIDSKNNIKPVRIFRIFNPEDKLSDNKNADLCIMHARGNRMYQFLIMQESSVKQEMDYMSARFLVNKGNQLTFLDGKLYGDSLLVFQHADFNEQFDVKTVNQNGEGDHNPVLFSFRVADDSGEKHFLIESWANGFGGSTGEWIKITKDIPVAVKTTYKNAVAGEADIFSYEVNNTIKTKAKEGIAQELADNDISIIAGYGTVTIQGAGGKKVLVSGSQGNVISNEIAHSNQITIAVPSGVVLVSIDNQPAIKTFVK